MKQGEVEYMGDISTPIGKSGSTLISSNWPIPPLIMFSSGKDTAINESIVHYYCMVR